MTCLVISALPGTRIVDYSVYAHLTGKMPSHHPMFASVQKRQAVIRPSCELVELCRSEVNQTDGTAAAASPLVFRCSILLLSIYLHIIASGHEMVDLSDTLVVDYKNP